MNLRDLAGHYVVTAALSPVLLWQGKRVRRIVPKLPEPPGERVGKAGSGESLRLLVLGDSAAAGVGAMHQRDGLCGQIIKHLSKDYQIEWTVFAKTGATTSLTIRKLRRLDGQRFDVVVMSLGVNDLTSGIVAKQWLQEQAELREQLRCRFGAKLLVVSGLPPVGQFPALPQPLRWHLGSRAALFNRQIREQLVSEIDSEYLRIDFSNDQQLMAADGFHPGPSAYAVWGRLVADRIMNRQQSGNEVGSSFAE